MVASEAVPFVKTGGLGDVCGALPKALRKLGHDARLILPRYWGIDPAYYKLTWTVSPMGVQMGNCIIWCGVWGGEVDGVPVYLIEHEGFYGRSRLYDDGQKEFGDNSDRFGFLCRAAIQLCRDLNWSPDIMHCNDWQTALVPAYLKVWERHDGFFANTASVLTIHNIAYQGWFPYGKYSYLGLGHENFSSDKFENFGRINFLKGGIFYADHITTVSPSYANEILSPGGGYGLAPYLSRRYWDITGILNGADYDHWDPATDPLLPANYSIEDMSGKAICKKKLQNDFGLEENPKIAIVGIVSRFTPQKGFQLLMPVISSIIHQMYIQFVILGAGEKPFENFFGNLPNCHRGRVGSWIGYNNDKAHLIEAGADFFIMPSLYEPCGLNQIYSMKYGTLPVVRNVGGLRDSVKNYNEGDGTGTGFIFNDPTPQAIFYTMGRICGTYYDRWHHIEAMRKQAMQENYSWEESAKKYLEVYDKALIRRASWR